MSTCSTASLGFVEVAGVTVYCQYHFAAMVSENCIFLRGEIVEQLLGVVKQSNVGSTALLRNRNFPHTFWTNFLSFLFRGAAVDSVLAYCFLAPYLIGAQGNGAC